MKIGLDFDGVITDCGKHKSKIALEVYGKEIQPKDFRKEILLAEKIFTAQEYIDFQILVYESEEYGLLIEQVTECFDYLALLLEQGHDIQIITARTGRSLDNAKTWLSINDRSLPIVGIHHTLPKTSVAKDCDIFIDDDLKKLLPMIGIVPNLYLMSWDYNAQDILPSEIIRVNSWSHFYETIINI